jgi:hypothetical protein
MSKRGNNGGSIYERSRAGGEVQSNSRMERGRYYRGSTGQDVAKKITAAPADMDTGLPIVTGES